MKCAAWCMSHDQWIMNQEPWCVMYEACFKSLHPQQWFMVESWSMDHESWLTTRDSWHMTHDSSHMIHDSWFTSHDSRLMIHDSWPMTHDSWSMTHESSSFKSHDVWTMAYMRISQDILQGVGVSVSSMGSIRVFAAWGGVGTLCVSLTVTCKRGDARLCKRPQGREQNGTTEGGGGAPLAYTGWKKWWPWGTWLMTHESWVMTSQKSDGREGHDSWKGDPPAPHLMAISWSSSLVLSPCKYISFTFISIYSYLLFYFYFILSISFSFVFCQYILYRS